MGLFDAFSDKPAIQASQAQISGINAGRNAAAPLLGQGLDYIGDTFTQRLAPLLQTYAGAGQGAGAYADATGANGPQGFDRTTSNFRTSPGYNFALNQGSENVMRRRAATGQLGSGGTDLELQKFGQGMADQEWQKYVQNLLPFVGQQTQTAGAVANTAAPQAALGNENLTKTAGLFNDAATGIGNANANAALAKYTASGNMLNALTKGGELATKLFGMMV